MSTVITARAIDARSEEIRRSAAVLDVVLGLTPETQLDVLRALAGDVLTPPDLLEALALRAQQKPTTPWAVGILGLLAVHPRLPERARCLLPI